MSEWFTKWFDTTYYHTLYKNRNETEANAFIDKLLTYLQPNADASFCDLACGKGRHAKRINESGYATVGLDLAANSIAEANLQASNNLQFYVHDMRQGFGVNRFNYITNLFTSFGYFNSLKENLKVLQHVHNALTTNGIFVIDFINVIPVIANFPIHEKKTIDGVQFNITKELINEHIVKRIEIIDGDAQHNYQERLQAITYEQLTTLLIQAGFTIDALFGNYELQPFNATQSPRVLIIAHKTATLANN
ncbi:MAG: methyltransferase domain-containing protein [Bacteroidia bacterium]|nr:methyltransferase domain-containing protein [Bacteroidia bacterium]